MMVQKTQWMFGGAVFLASFLLFLVEPMAAKQLVPVFGGSAAVWITCLVFFQTALLAGYAYAFWLVRAQRAWRLHAGLLLAGVVAALWWARVHGVMVAGGPPVLRIFAVLAGSIGLPFLLLASTSPLMQAWFARVTGEGVPYRLFALSNLASLLALGLYPSLIEPYVTLRWQRVGWGLAFVVFAVLAIRAGALARGGSSRWSSGETALDGLEGGSLRDTHPSFARMGHPVLTGNAALSRDVSPFLDKVLWVLLPLAASMQLSAVTSHLTENIAAIPLLWVLPLAVYLLSLIFAFEYSRWLPRPVVTRFLALMLASLGYLVVKGGCVAAGESQYSDLPGGVVCGMPVLPCGGVCTAAARGGGVHFVLPDVCGGWCAGIVLHRDYVPAACSLRTTTWRCRSWRPRCWRWW